MLELETWRRHTHAQRLLACSWMLVLASGVALAVHRAWVSDDIYISFRYADNVLAGRGPVYNEGERSEGYTHFLWFLLLVLGRGLGIPAHLLGKYLAFPAYIGCLVVLVRISARLFPGRGGLWGAPVAALGWALHEDARLFASGGLETASFTFLLLVGFDFLTLSRRRRHAALAGWAFATATLVRPDGLLFSFLAAAYLVWRERAVLREYVPVWLVLVAPQFAFRMLYYGYPFPNPYYAKSGGLANWAQGRTYTEMYFHCYFVLAVAVLAVVPLVLALVGRKRPGPLRDAAPPLALALVASLLATFYVTRVGGDFMFGRFLLPVTPFLLLLLEYLVHHLPRPAWRVAACLVAGALLVWGGVRKQGLLHDKYTVRGIVDEPQFYPDARLVDIRDWSEALRSCLADTRAIVMVQGGQASLAYYSQFPVALERYGLTDVHIAHSPIARRGRPGHEKEATPEYLYGRGVNLRIHYRPVRNLPPWAQIDLASASGSQRVSGEIIVYDRELMEHLKQCKGARFRDFPNYLERYYIPVEVPRRAPKHLIEDWSAFQRFYFDHNPDPEQLQQKLRAALEGRGIYDFPVVPVSPDLFQDSGRPTSTD